MVIVGAGGRHIAEADALEPRVRLHDVQRRIGAGIPAQDPSMGAGQDVRRDRRGRSGGRHAGRSAVRARRGLAIASRLNGVTMQDSNTANMMFPVAKTIAILSEFTTLEPGDMIALGTPPGVGHARRPPVWMKPGDVVEVEIEGIGLCRNPIVAEGDGAMTEAAE